MKSKVYFSREVTPAKISEMYDLVSANLEGKTAIKLHSGEVGNQNFLGPDFWADVIKRTAESSPNAIPHTQAHATPPKSTLKPSKNTAGASTSRLTFLTRKEKIWFSTFPTARL